MDNDAFNKFVNDVRSAMDAEAEEAKRIPWLKIIAFAASLLVIVILL